MKRVFVLLMLSFFSFFSCKKEKLKEDGEVLIGKWKWTYSSVNVNGLCYNNSGSSGISSYFATINPTTENTIYYIEFLEKGKIIFSEENTVLSEEKILWEMSEISADKCFYELYFDKEIKLDGIINQDTLMENRLFPFPDTDCDDYTNFFVRE
jgi:hypothetical protein